MPDREKVIREKLDEMVELTRGLNYVGFMTAVENANEILALLKEQEPKQVEAEVINEIDRLYRCPSCHISMILRKQPYCHSCGQAVKWDA